MRSAPPSCPVCGHDLLDAQSIYVCGRCHVSMQATGAISVHTTAEFPAMSQLAFAPDGGVPNIGGGPRAPTDPGQTSCTWCGKSGKDVRKLLSQSGAHICDECVALCADIMTTELGEGWR
jgi:hypothetical protein